MDCWAHFVRLFSLWGIFIRKRQAFPFEQSFKTCLREEAPCGDSWALANLNIGIKKRLEEIQAENENMVNKFAFREHQKLFNRLLSDIKNISQWHDLSIEMLIGDQNANREENGQTLSPAPEEIRLKMPDMSALNIKDGSLHNSLLNDSANFNLDEFLVSKQKDNILFGLNHTTSISNNNYNTANFTTTLTNNYQTNQRNFVSSSPHANTINFIDMGSPIAPPQVLTKFDSHIAAHQRQASRGLPLSPMSQGNGFPALNSKSQITNSQQLIIPAKLEELSKFLEETPQLDDNETVNVLNWIKDLVDRAEVVISKSRQSLNLKERTKTLEDRKLRILALSFLIRRKD